MSSAHTPAPWLIDRYSVYAMGKAKGWRGKPYGAAICLAPDQEENPCTLWLEDWPANSRLIAAAPEMLAALKAIVKSKSASDYDDASIVDTAAIAMAEAAISKAETA